MPETTDTAGATTQPSAEVVAAAADKLCKLIRENQLTLDFAGGRIVIEAFFGGDLEAWNKRNTGDQSIEALAKVMEERDPDWTSQRLYRAVRFYEQWKMLGNFEEWPHLMPSHYRTVQGLSWDRQRELLTKANAERWSIAALVSAIGHRKREFPAAPAAAARDALKVLKAAERVLDQQDHLLADLSEAGLAAESSERLQKAGDAYRAEVERVRGELTPKQSTAQGKKIA